MDPFTHLASGWVSGLALGQRNQRAKALGFCALMAALPDIDIVFSFDPEWMLLYRRAVTHSIMGILLLALLGTYLGRKIFPDIKRIQLFIICIFLLCLHVFLDLINSYGTQVLWPFSQERYAWDLVFIVDPILLVVLATLGILGWFSGGPKRLWGLAGVGLCLLYPLASLGIREYARNQVTRTDVISHLQPDAFSPLYWKIIDEEPGQEGATYSLRLWSAFDGVQPVGINLKWRKTEWNTDLDENPRYPSFLKTYAWFSRFPASPLHNHPGRGFLHEDLRFLSAHDWLRDARDSDNPSAPSPFSLFITTTRYTDGDFGINTIEFDGERVFAYQP